ncbi:uncharacterized protein LOC123869865 [Maniola jurtina]|uniref:uncharacterized protein LOC123869865 n=1 Tax=Maniola jurtina TaxID=191418 RepID=UPI001E68E7AD|nr:uncharacterized protein LOC123869865 [Maniola jurtina]
MFAKVACFALVLIVWECNAQGPKDLPPVNLPNPPAPLPSLPLGQVSNPSNTIQNVPGFGNLLNTLASAGQSTNVLGPLGNLQSTQRIIGQINEEMDIERPCRVNDVSCIRHFFLHHSKCEEAHGPVPEPLHRKVSTTYFPRINLTLTATDVLYSGLNGKIVEFFIDKETDNLLISVEFRNVTFYSKEAYYRFHRKAKLPVVNKDFIFLNFPSFTTTTIIPHISELQLDKSETTTFVEDPTLVFSLGPKAFVSSDPAVPATLPVLYLDIRTGLQELFLTEGTFYAAVFIQKVICDFGLELL